MTQRYALGRSVPPGTRLRRPEHDEVTKVTNSPAHCNLDSMTCMCAAGVVGALSTVLITVLLAACARYLGGGGFAPIDEKFDGVVLVQVDSISNPHERSLCVLAA